MVKFIDIGGEKRPVRYSVNALIEFEEMTGLNILSAGSVIDFRELKTLRALAFVGLKHGARAEKKQFDIVIEDVGDWLAIGDGSMELIVKSFQQDAVSGNVTNSNVEATEKN